MSTLESQGLPSRLAEGLRALDHHVRSLAVLRGLALCVVVFGTGLLAGVLIDWCFDLGGPVRTGILGVVLLAVLGTLAHFVVRPLIRRPVATELAALVDAAYPEYGERFESAVELTDPAVPEWHKGSALMRSLLTEEVADGAGDVDFRGAADTRPVFRAVLVAAAALLLLLAPFGLSQQGYALLLSRFLTPWRNLERPTNLYFEVSPGDSVVARGSDVMIRATPHWRVGSGELPESVWLNWHNADGGTDARRMTLDPSQTDYVATLPHVVSPFDFDVSADGARTRTFHVDVVEAPDLTALSLEVEPPAYSGQPVRTLDGPVGLIDVFERSRLTWQASFNKPIAQVEFLWLDDAGQPRTAAQEPSAQDAAPSSLPFELTEDGGRGTLSMTAMRGGLFEIRLTDEHGLTNRSVSHREIVLIRDEPPAIAWADVSGPAALNTALEVRTSDVVHIPVIAADDVALHALELHLEIVQRSEPLPIIEVPGESLGQREVEHSFAVDLSQLGLREGELLSLKGRAADGRPEPGPQEAWTQARMVRITADAAPLAEADLQQEQQKLREILEAIQQEVVQDRSDVQQYQREAKAQPDQQQPLPHADALTQLAEEEAALIDRIEQLAALFSGHPLLQNIAEATREIGTGPLEAAHQAVSRTVSSPAREQAQQLQQAGRQLARAAKDLEQLLKRFDELAALERDLLELQRLAESAQRLADDVADFEQDWQNLKEDAALPEQARADRTSELQDVRDSLQGEQEELTGALDRLLEERPEIIQAAIEFQQEQLEQLAARADALAAREAQVAQALSQEPAAPPEPAASTANGTPPADATQPPAEPADVPAQPSSAESTSAASSGDPHRPTPGEQLQQLAEHAAKLALDTARSEGVDTPAATQAQKLAQQTMTAADETQSGLLEEAARSSRDAAQSAEQTAEALDRPESQAPGQLTSQAREMARQLTELADTLSQQAQSQPTRQAAQAQGQQRLSQQTSALSRQLEEAASRLQSEPLDKSQAGEQAAQAGELAEQASQQMRDAQQAVTSGAQPQAAQSARESAQNLKQSARQARQAAGQNSGQGSPVPGQVAQDVTDARQQLSQAAAQLQHAEADAAGPPQRAESTPAGEPGEPEPPSDGQSPAAGEGSQPQPGEQGSANPQSGATGQPAPGQQPGSQSGTPPGSQPGQNVPGMTTSEAGQSPAGAPTEPSDGATQSLRQAADSLQQAAEQLGMSPGRRGRQGQSGQKSGDEASAGAPGQQGGNSSGEGISLAELETELRRLSSRNWGQLPPHVESELFHSRQREPDADYARLIRLYFEELSRQRSAAEGLE
jgi:hypothetical protein